MSNRIENGSLRPPILEEEQKLPELLLGELNRAREEQVGMREQLAAQRNENREARIEVIQNQRALGAARQQIGEQQGKISGLEETVTRLEVQLRAEIQVRDELRQRLNQELQAQLARRDQDLVAQNQGADLQRTINNLQAQVDASGKRIGVLDQQLEGERRRMLRQTRMNALRVKILELEKEREEINHQMTGVTLTGTLLFGFLSGPLIGAATFFSLALGLDVPRHRVAYEEKLVAEGELKTMIQEDEKQ